MFRLGGAGLVIALLAASFSAQASASTFQVDKTADSGAGSLRQAILDANADPFAPHLIDARGVTGTINLEASLPDLARSMEIRGPGADLLTVRRQSDALFRIFKTNAGATVELRGITISNGNRTDHLEGFGGGVRNDGTLTLREVAVRDNVAINPSFGGWGGGIHSTGSLTVVDSVIAGNATYAFPGAGGGAISANGPVTLVATQITGNEASLGGGLYIYDGAPLSIVNSTIANNASDDGGGFWANGPTTIRSSTIARNTVTFAGAAANLSLNDSAGLQVQNSMIAEPLPNGRANCALSSGATVSSHGHNLSDDESCDLSSIADQEGVADVMLGPLADNGGPTRTIAPLPGSPAVDQGHSLDLAFDQRGLPRPSDFPGISNPPSGNGADIGAVELQVPPPVAPPAEPPDETDPPDEETPAVALRASFVKKKHRARPRARIKVPLRLNSRARVTLLVRNRKSGKRVGKKARRILPAGRSALRIRVPKQQGKYRLAMVARGMDGQTVRAQVPLRVKRRR